MSGGAVPNFINKTKKKAVNFGTSGQPQGTPLPAGVNIPTPPALQNDLQQATQATLPPPTPAPTSTPTLKPVKPEVIRDTVTGEPTGVRLPSGEVFQGLNKQQVEAQINAFNGNSTPAGAQEAGTARLAQEQAAAASQAVGQFGSQQNPSVQIPQENLSTVAGLAIKSIIGGAIAGGAVGTAITPGLGTAIGAGIGGATAFLSALAVDRHQATKEAFKVFSKSSSGQYNALLFAANHGANPADVQVGYDTMLANVRASQAALKAQTQTTVGKQLSGAQDELLSVELWLQNEPLYRARIQQAILTPDPNSPIPQPEPEVTSG